MKAEEKLYMIFATAFAVIVVVGNLIFQKFVTVSIFALKTEVSVGVLLYPLTFLISDLVAEFYGAKRAQFMVNMTLAINTFIVGLLCLANYLPATAWSTMSDSEFKRIFNGSAVCTIASLCAMYLGQTMDILIYTRIKSMTRGKHLWLRNNVSTILAQLVDTLCVTLIMAAFGMVPPGKTMLLICNSMTFKFIAALCDTPFCYLGHYSIKRLLNSPKRDVSI